MLVRDRMNPNVCVVTPETPLPEAMRIMRDRRIRRLPVLKHGRVAGIVTWTDLMSAQPSMATTLSRWEIPTLLDKVQIREVMSKSVHVVSPDVPIEEAAAVMRDRKIGGLPVVRDGTLVGIITESDIFDAFVDLLGGGRPSYRITLDVDDRPQTLLDVTAAFRQIGLVMLSLATYPGAEGRLCVIVRVDRTMPLDQLLLTLEERGLTVTHAADGEQVLEPALA